MLTAEVNSLTPTVDVQLLSRHL